MWPLSKNSLREVILFKWACQEWSNPVWLASSKEEDVWVHTPRGMAKEEAWGETALPATFLDIVLDLVLAASRTIFFCLGDGSLLVKWGQGQYLNLQVNNPSLGEDRAETQSRSWCISQEVMMLAGLSTNSCSHSFLVQPESAGGGSSSLWVAPFPVQANFIR